nr:hypothetical protein [Tanacetum cinerariifolium]
MTMHEVVHEMVVGECHEPNSKGSGSAWKEYVNARVAGLFLLVLLEYPNGKGVVRATSRGLDMAPHWDEEKFLQKSIKWIRRAIMVELDYITGGDTFNAINKNGRQKRAEEDFATTAFRAGPLCQTPTKLQLELIHHCYGGLTNFSGEAIDNVLLNLGKCLLDFVKGGESEGNQRGTGQTLRSGSATKAWDSLILIHIQLAMSASCANNVIPRDTGEAIVAQTEVVGICDLNSTYASTDPWPTHKFGSGHQKGLVVCNQGET